MSALDDLVLFYKNTQKDGLKNCNEQIKMFDENCLWLSFSSSEVVSGGGVKVAKGRAELLTLFEKYNDTVRDFYIINIEYLNQFTDEENRVCGFNMLITLQKSKSEQPNQFFNTLELHVNQNNKVFKAYNWMGCLPDQFLIDKYIKV